VIFSASVDISNAIAKLKAIPAKVHAGVAQTLQDNARQLLRKIQDKLSGSVLQLRSGALRDSFVETGIVAGASTISDSVTSDGTVAYAHIQEYGGRVSIPEITPRSAKALAFEYGGKLVFARHARAHVVDIPERSYLRSSLAEQIDILTDDIRRVVNESIV